MDVNTILNIIIAILIIWFVYSRFGPTKGLRTLNDEAFRKEIDHSSKYILVDVREPFEFKVGYITGAKNIPLSQLKQRMDEIPKDRDVFLYCKSGMRSKNAAKLLQKRGYTSMAHLQGGISVWKGKLS